LIGGTVALSIGLSTSFGDGCGFGSVIHSSVSFLSTISRERFLLNFGTRTFLFGTPTGACPGGLSGCDTGSTGGVCAGSFGFGVSSGMFIPVCFVVAQGLSEYPRCLWDGMPSFRSILELRHFSSVALNS
jgi:hypothetical protein